MRIGRTLRRRRSVAFALLVVVVLAGLIVADGCGWLRPPRQGDVAVYDGLVTTVTYTHDGDTIEIAAPDATTGADTTRVRLWGVDCPELGRDGAPDAPGAAAARDRVEALVATGPVTLHLEPTRARGRYQRILAHVELADGTLLNERLLAEGLARTDERWGHEHLDRYERAEKRARATPP
ncbi:MAG: thermonuclease family protein [Phycisphaerae bacterium]|nr:thermonuclease family protein [Phycisphaerae bacterium]